MPPVALEQERAAILEAEAAKVEQADAAIKEAVNAVHETALVLRDSREVNAELRQRRRENNFTERIMRSMQIHTGGLRS